MEKVDREKEENRIRKKQWHEDLDMWAKTLKNIGWIIAFMASMALNIWKVIIPWVQGWGK